MELANADGVVHFSLAQAKALLNLFPVSGLREAAANMNLPIADPKSKDKNIYIEPILQALLANDITYKKEKINCGPMWDDCFKVSVPYKWKEDHVPSSTLEIAVIKREIMDRIDKFLDDLRPLDTIVEICAGKVSSATKTAERSGYEKRWRGRYGKPEYGFTCMRRLYADAVEIRTIADDRMYKKREEFALEMEEHAFRYLDQLKRNGVLPATVKIPFGDDQGRTNTGKSFGPQWKVFVYLAIKLKR